MEHTTIITKNGIKVPEYNITAAKIVDKTIVLFGKSNSGKTTMVKYLMSLLKDYIPVAFVVSPTEPSNKSYEKFIDRALIHFDLATDKDGNNFLQSLWEWQEMRAALYTKASKMDTLLSIYKLIPNSEIDDTLAKIRQRKREAEDIQLISKREQALKQIEELMTKLLKRYISQKKSTLDSYRSDLDEEQRYSLTYIDLNPKVLIIFDDCAAELKSYFNKPIFRKIFYQSRHSFITSMFCCQDDTDLPANLRKNVAVSMFMQAQVAKSNFERSTNKFPKDVQQKAISITNELYVGHRKLVYVENDPDKQHFYHKTAKNIEPFKFGTERLHKVCVAVENTSGSVDKNNAFYSAFKID